MFIFISLLLQKHCSVNPQISVQPLTALTNPCIVVLFSECVIIPFTLLNFSAKSSWLETITVSFAVEIQLFATIIKLT
ncbi:hypothetical protein A9R01_17425 ['Osedax' symbiont bacterium Rs2_46_30_T18]|nr:hypothetical protein A9R01_17425 ['Osedax' symbiont bacterium Rs2_46_30_T18]